MNTYEKELPEGYQQVYHIDAANKKTGMIFTIASLLPTAAVIALVVLTASKSAMDKFLSYESSWALSVLALIMLAYVVLHELVHGIAYKSLTKEKLTFGLKWSCAFCGVPNIFVYRKTALIALLAPFTVFSLLFAALSVYFGIVGSIWYLIFGINFAFHLGGCCGDLYMTYLLLVKYKDPTLLVKDTGPEQFLYVIKEKEGI